MEEECCPDSARIGCIDRVKIKQLRKDRGLEFHDLRDLCGVPPTTLWKIEVLPRYRVQMCDIYKLAFAYNLTVDDLLIKPVVVVV